MKSHIRKTKAAIVPGLAVTLLALGTFAAPVTLHAQETANLGARTAYCCLKKPPRVGRGRWTKKCYVARVASRTHRTATSSYWTVLVTKPVCKWVQG